MFKRKGKCHHKQKGQREGCGETGGKTDLTAIKNNAQARVVKSLEFRMWNFLAKQQLAALAVLFGSEMVGTSCTIQMSFLKSCLCMASGSVSKRMSVFEANPNQVVFVYL